MEELAGSVYGSYKLTEYIHKGSFGFIYKAIRISDIPGSTDQSSKDIYAAKVISLNNATDRQREVIQREIELLKKAETFKNEHIVSYIDHVVDREMACIVMEFCDGGSLYQYIQDLRSKNKVMGEREFMDIMRQIALGVEFLHDNSFMHRDLKTKNILMTKDRGIKIGDFGVTRIIEIKKMCSPLTKEVGTPYYMSPEMMEKKDYDQKSDKEMEELAGSVYGSYKLTEYIHKGSFGFIYKAIRISDIPGSTDQSSKDIYAAKVISLNNATDRQREVIQREIELLKKAETFKNEHIVSYIDHVVDREMACIVMEFCDGGSLYQYIQDLRSKNKVMGEREFMDIMRQIALGVEFLHDNSFMHRDLKTKNILMTKDRGIKIGDFGVTRIIEIKKMCSPLTKEVGTPYYMSPEMMEKKDYDQKTDIWSLGCTCFEMATGQYAFGEESMARIKEIVCSGKIPDLSRINYSEEVKHMITQMLAKSSRSRPTIKQILTFIQKHCESTENAESTSERDRPQQSMSDYESGDDLATRNKNKRFLEKQSEKLQKTVIKEIGGHKAPEILVIIKSLLKRKTEQSEFRKKILPMIGVAKYDRLYPLMKAINCLEEGIRALKPVGDLSLSLSEMEITLPGSEQSFKT